MSMYPNNNPPSYEPPMQQPVQDPMQQPVQDPMQQPMQQFTQPMQQPMPAMTPPVPPVKKKKTGLIIGIIVGVLILLGAGAFFLITFMNKQNTIRTYNQGAAYLEAGDYKKAYEVFSSLGDYEDAPQIAAYAEKGIRYTAAKKDMARENYAEAKEVFESLNGFKDSDALAKECGRAIAYEDGLALYQSGQFQEAISLLEQSESYENADELIKEAQTAIAFEKGKALFDSGDYEGALEALKDVKDYEGTAELEEQCHIFLIEDEILGAIEAEEYETALDLLDSEYAQKIENRYDLIQECENGLRYMEADAAYREELYYTAYTIFEELGSFRDSQSRMASCIQTTPSTGEIYHNPSYTSTSVTLEIDPNTNDGSYTYFKVYIVEGSSETLVSCVFIRSGETATIDLPSGVFILKTASSYGDWFGQKQMFGDNATYSRLTSTDAGSDRFALESNHDYILTLSHAEDGNVGNQSESMDSF
ncbi:MAG: tetratricopeptide repeat protein [Firmicutes bacterium]|nr:tetratricopeptide repeat protein [Bacillota bacterium]